MIRNWLKPTLLKEFSWKTHLKKFPHSRTFLRLGKISKNLKIFDFRFLAQNDQKLAETYSPERIFAKKRIFKNFPRVGLFWDLEKFRKISKFSIFVFWPKLAGNMLKHALPVTFWQKINFEHFPHSSVLRLGLAIKRKVWHLVCGLPTSTTRFKMVQPGLICKSK